MAMDDAEDYLRSHHDEWTGALEAVVGPEPVILTALLDLTTGMDAMHWANEQMALTRSARDIMHLLAWLAVTTSSVFDRHEMLLKRASRRRLITKRLAAARLDVAATFLDEDRVFHGYRDSIAHGVGNLNDLNALAERERFWEMFALARLRAGELPAFHINPSDPRSPPPDALARTTAVDQMVAETLNAMTAEVTALPTHELY
jgi:hypothetical protein